jgi:hypothetical protein
LGGLKDANAEMPTGLPSGKVESACVVRLAKRDAWNTGAERRIDGAAGFRESKDRVGTRMQSQRELLTQSGVPEAPAALLGVLHDMAFDPFSSVGSSVRLARAGMSGQAIRNLAQESYLYGGFLADEGIRSLGDLRFDDMPKVLHATGVKKQETKSNIQDSSQ